MGVRPGGDRKWACSALQGGGAALLIVLLYARWFVRADRHILFLYWHNMGPAYPDTGPFSRVTASRYWMAGLVAGGAVLALCTAINWLLGRLRRDYRPAAGWRAWLVGAPVLAIALPLIVMTANQPRLPALHALKTTSVALFGLALGLMPGRMAAAQPWTLFRLSLDGFCLALVLYAVAMTERAVDLATRGISGAALLLALVFVTALLGLTAMSILYVWRRWPIPSASGILIAGLGIVYPLGALAHHLFVGLEGHWYISDSDNFFSRSWALQIVAWGVGLGLALVVTWLRRLVAWRRASSGKQPL